MVSAGMREMNRSTDTAADHRIDLEPPGSAEDGFDEAAA